MRDALGLHLGRFPEGAPLRGVIASDAVQDLLARFDKADANSDGTISTDERKAARQAMREAWRAKRGDDARQ